MPPRAPVPPRDRGQRTPDPAATPDLDTSRNARPASRGPLLLFAVGALLAASGFREATWRGAGVHRGADIQSGS